jgi:hypothetical protein
MNVIDVMCYMDDAEVSRRFGEGRNDLVTLRGELSNSAHPC